MNKDMTLLNDLSSDISSAIWKSLHNVIYISDNNIW